MWWSRTYYQGLPDETSTKRRTISDLRSTKRVSERRSSNQRKKAKTCIKVRFRHHSLSALLDTGSDISIAGNEAARKYKWEIHLHPIKTVKIANGETMITYGAARIPIHVGKRKVDSEILISPGMNGLIIGIDWLEKQGQFVWDFRENRIKFKDNEWLKLQKEDETKRVRRVYVSEDTLLPAS